MSSIYSNCKKSYGFIQHFAEKIFDDEIAELLRDDLFSFGIDRNDYDFSMTQDYDVDDLIYDEEAICDLLKSNACKTL